MKLRSLLFGLVLVGAVLISGCAAPEPAIGPAENVTPATLPTRIVSVNIQSINIIEDTAGAPLTASFTVQAKIQGDANETVNYACKATYFDALVDPGTNLIRQIPAAGEMTNTFTFSTSARGKSPEKSRWGVCCELLPLDSFTEKTTKTICATGV